MWRTAAYTGLLCLITLSASAQSPGDPVDGELLVKFVGEPPALMSGSLVEAGAVQVRPFVPAGSALQGANDLSSWVHVVLDPEADVEDAITTLEADPTIELVQPNVWGQLLAIPNDARFEEQWSLHNNGQTGGTSDADTDAIELWDLQTSAADVVVAIIDSGIDINHVDLAANLWVNVDEVAGDNDDDDANGYADDRHGVNFFATGNPIDDHFQGHGTHVAGIIGAVGNNVIGIAGIAWDVQLMAIKAFNNIGQTTCALVAYGVVYALLNGADIINASFVMANCPVLFSAVELADAANVPVVAAAGNAGLNNDSIVAEPANYPLANVITVAASDHNDQLASFSNYGPKNVDVVAPGVAILSTLPSDQYGTLSGTSQATPHITGLLAVLQQQYPSATPADLKTTLVNSVDAPTSATTVGGGIGINMPIAYAKGDDFIGVGWKYWICEDSVDNDGDTLMDYPADPGCLDRYIPFAASQKENPQCNDLADNDGDTKTDLTDPQCGSAKDTSESCGLGFEVAPIMLLLEVARRRRGKVAEF